MYYLESNSLVVSVNSFGAELSGIKCKKTGMEYLWQGEAPFWRGRSPVLFPMVGRLHNSMYSYKGKTFEMPIHGFASKSDFTVTEELGKLIFTLQDSPATRLIYPFAFLLEVVFTLEGQRITTEYKVTNPSDSEELVFGIGGHPGLMFNDYYLEFEGVDVLTGTVVSERGFLKDETFQLSLKNSCLPLTYDLFEKYLTLVFVDTPAKKVTLKSAKDDISVAMEFDTQHFGVWTQPGAPFVCLEPWDGLPDYEGFCGDFSNKRGNHILMPGDFKIFSTSIKID